MTVNITLEAPPFSINKAYYKRSHTRTKECRDWGDDILLQLQHPSVLAQIRAFKETFNPLDHGIAVYLGFNIPKDKFYTVEGSISRRSMDLSNVEKLLIDLIFDNRFHGRVIKKVPIENLDLDDKHIHILVSEKKPTVKAGFIEVSIERTDL